MTEQTALAQRRLIDIKGRELDLDTLTFEQAVEYGKNALAQLAYSRDTLLALSMSAAVERGGLKRFAEAIDVKYNTLKTWRSRHLDESQKRIYTKAAPVELPAPEYAPTKVDAVHNSESDSEYPKSAPVERSVEVVEITPPANDGKRPIVSRARMQLLQKRVDAYKADMGRVAFALDAEPHAEVDDLLDRINALKEAAK